MKVVSITVLYRAYIVYSFLVNVALIFLSGELLYDWFGVSYRTIIELGLCISLAYVVTVLLLVFYVGGVFLYYRLGGEQE